MPDVSPVWNSHPERCGRIRSRSGHGQRHHRSTVNWAECRSACGMASPSSRENHWCLPRFWRRWRHGIRSPGPLSRDPGERGQIRDSQDRHCRRIQLCGRHYRAVHLDRPEVPFLRGSFFESHHRTYASTKRYVFLFLSGLRGRFLGPVVEPRFEMRQPPDFLCWEGPGAGVRALEFVA